jgi:hypothetical protein
MAKSEAMASRAPAQRAMLLEAYATGGRISKAAVSVTGFLK